MRLSLSSLCRCDSQPLAVSRQAGSDAWAGRSFLAALGITGVTLASQSVRAADVYWDIDGTTAGAGGAAPAGNWNTSTSNWSASSTGSSSTANWINGDSAIFSAGTNATGAFIVTNGGVTVDNITQQEGKVTISGSTLTLADTSMTIDVQTRTTGGDYDLRINSVIGNSSGGASGIIKNGAGILHLGTGSNTFSGGITLNAGTIAIESNGAALGTGTLTLAGGNFVKSYGTSGTAVGTVSNAISVTGTTNVGIVQGNAGNLSFTGNWDAGSTSGSFSVGNVNINSLSIQSSTIQISGDVSSYTGTFSHNTLASGGNRLRFGSNVGSNGTTPTLSSIDASNSKFLLSGSTGGSNSVDMGDGRYGSFKIGELAGTGGNIRAGWAGGNGNNTTFEVGALGSNSKFAGALRDNLNTNISGQTGGRAALEKVGSGTLELSLAGGNDYSGGTIVTSGILLASNTSGSATGTGAVTVGANGTLGGTGIITTSAGVTVNGTIAAGGAVTATTGGSYSSTIGTLTVNAATTFNDSSIFAWDVSSAGTSYDKMKVNSLADGGSAGGSIFRIVLADASFSNGFWSDGIKSWSDIFTTNGTAPIANWANIFTIMQVVDSNGSPVSPTGGSFSLSGNTLTWSAVPEPTSALGGMLIAAGLLRRRR